MVSCGELGLAPPRRDLSICPGLTGAKEMSIFQQIQTLFLLTLLCSHKGPH